MDPMSPRENQQQQGAIVPSSPLNSCDSNDDDGAVHTSLLPPLSPTTPTSAPSSEPYTIYPTTFVQATSSSFCQVVQMLTGCDDTAKAISESLIPSIIPTPTTPITNTNTIPNITTSFTPNTNTNTIPNMPTSFTITPTPTNGNNRNMPTSFTITPTTTTTNHNIYNMATPFNTSNNNNNGHMFMQAKPDSQGIRLYQRRNYNMNPLMPSFPPPMMPPPRAETISPTYLNFPALNLSPVTPLISDPFVQYGVPSAAVAGAGYQVYPIVNHNVNPSSPATVFNVVPAEGRAMQERGYFLNPTTTAAASTSAPPTPRDAEPRLLNLFPTTSSRAQGGGSGPSSPSPST
ncbi:hypothetical protein RIF29_35902 [Crotalaria pallida]|uniref:VQ domain-containing protein n=1 Tax=Crotalaria pallida TaxID=3830 RepID=A0AAN9EG51_CROPI